MGRVVRTVWMWVVIEGLLDCVSRGGAVVSTV